MQKLDGNAILSHQICSELVYTAPECERKIGQSCGRNYNKFECRAAFDYCKTELMNSLATTKRNCYNINKSCGGNDLDCYPEIEQVRKYLSKNSTKDMLGVPRNHNFQVISWLLHEAFVDAGDMYDPSDSYVVGLLERGVRVLVYVGTNDLACNFVGNYRTVQGLDWSGGSKFASTELTPWSVNGHTAGETKSHGRLTFATVRGAGHMVPFDKPEEAAYMLEKWVANEHLGD